MKVLIVNRSEVLQLLPMNECIDVMTEALKTLARGEAILPLRQVMGLKVSSVFPGNHGTEYDPHIGVVMLFETLHGQLLAIVDASEITAIRTAATTAVATKLLALGNAGDLAILGSGVQARTHLEAMLLIRKIRRVRVWSRNSEHARCFAVGESQRHGITVEPMETAQAAVEKADIICTTTAAPEPILLGEYISDGTHINAIGSSVPFTRELDTTAVAKSRLFADRRESTLNEAGDFLFPKKEGAIRDSHILGEIGEILLGKVEGRKRPEEITLFKSSGLAIEDLASTYHILEKAREKDIGTHVELGLIPQRYS